MANYYKPMEQVLLAGIFVLIKVLFSSSQLVKNVCQTEIVSVVGIVFTANILFGAELKW